ncbi:MAG: SRPBCC family protein [Thermomicrobiales bacterium]
MTAEPNGKLFRTNGARTLEISRTFRAPIEEVWAALTESERTGRWIGTWTGDAGPGKTIDFIMTSEGVTEPSPVTITECEPPRLLALDMASPGGVWRIRVALTEKDSSTTAVFHHHLGDEDDIADIGPGWEYYFDRLIASMNDADMPNWDDYYPAQKDFYASLTPADDLAQ